MTVRVRTLTAVQTTTVAQGARAGLAETIREQAQKLVVVGSHLKQAGWILARADGINVGIEYAGLMLLAGASGIAARSNQPAEALYCAVELMFQLGEAHGRCHANLEAWLEENTATNAGADEVRALVEEHTAQLWADAKMQLGLLVAHIAEPLRRLA